jgi:hypothetical protein
MNLHTSRLVAALVAAAASTGGLAAPALAGQFTLGLTAPPGAAVGKPMLLQAAGTMPVEDVTFPYFLISVALPTSVTQTCPAGYWDAVQIANATGGGILDLSAPITPSSTGAWSIPIGLRPWAPGRLLICAYVGDGADTTLAGASLTLEITAAGARPVNVSAPRVVRSAAGVSCQAGRWANAPSTYAYAWLASGRLVASGRTLRPGPGLAGRQVRCRVTAANSAGATVALSAPIRVP